MAPALAHQSLHLTFSTTWTVWLPEAAVPLMVRVWSPVGVVLEVVTLNAELPPVVTAVGLKVAVDPAGTPLTEKVTLWALPETIAVLTV